MKRPRLRTLQPVPGFVDNAPIFLATLCLVCPGIFILVFRLHARRKTSLRRPRVLSQVILLPFLTSRLGPLRGRHVSFGHKRLLPTVNKAWFDDNLPHRSQW